MEELDSQHVSLQFFLEHLLMLEHPRIHPEAFLGYPHLHAGYFTGFTDAEKDRLKTHGVNPFIHFKIEYNVSFPLIG
jgi:hypothetical protein